MGAFAAYDPKLSGNYLSTPATFEPRYIPSKDSIEYQVSKRILCSLLLQG